MLKSGLSRLGLGRSSSKLETSKPKANFVTQTSTAANNGTAQVPTSMDSVVTKKMALSKRILLQRSGTTPTNNNNHNDILDNTEEAHATQVDHQIQTQTAQKNLHRQATSPLPAPRPTRHQRTNTREEWQQNQTNNLHSLQNQLANQRQQHLAKLSRQSTANRYPHNSSLNAGESTPPQPPQTSPSPTFPTPTSPSLSSRSRPARLVTAKSTPLRSDSPRTSSFPRTPRNTTQTRAARSSTLTSPHMPARPTRAARASTAAAPLSPQQVGAKPRLARYASNNTTPTANPQPPPRLHLRQTSAIFTPPREQQQHLEQQQRQKELLQAEEILGSKSFTDCGCDDTESSPSFMKTQMIRNRTEPTWFEQWSVEIDEMETRLQNMGFARSPTSPHHSSNLSHSHSQSFHCDENDPLPPEEPCPPCDAPPSPPAPSLAEIGTTKPIKAPPPRKPLRSQVDSQLSNPHSAHAAEIEGEVVQKPAHARTQSSSELPRFHVFAVHRRASSTRKKVRLERIKAERAALEEDTQRFLFGDSVDYSMALNSTVKSLDQILNRVSDADEMERNSPVNFISDAPQAPTQAQSKQPTRKPIAFRSF